MPDQERIEEGEKWARAQRERIQQSANDKAKQLHRIYSEHLEWFKHHTVESLIESRRPLKRPRLADPIPATSDQVQLVHSSRPSSSLDSPRTSHGDNENSPMRSFGRQSITNRSLFPSSPNPQSRSSTIPPSKSCDSKDLIHPPPLSSPVAASSECHDTLSRASHPSGPKSSTFNSTGSVRNQRSSLLSKDQDEPDKLAEAKDERPTNRSVALTTATMKHSPKQPETPVNQHDPGRLDVSKNPTDEQQLPDKDGDQRPIDPDFQLGETPSWAEAPELEQHLLRQCNMDGHKIFGRILPLVTSEIFSDIRRRPTRSSQISSTL